MTLLAPRLSCLFKSLWIVSHISPGPQDNVFRKTLDVIFFYHSTAANDPETRAAKWNSAIIHFIKHLCKNVNNENISCQNSCFCSAYSSDNSFNLSKRFTFVPLSSPHFTIFSNSSFNCNDTACNVTELPDVNIKEKCNSTICCMFVTMSDMFYYLRKV